MATVLLKPTRGGRPIVLDKPILLIGRHPDCDVILKDSVKISRKHCCVALVDHRFVVRDLDSMNGVWVNGARVQHSADLKFGDELMIGDLPFEVARHGVAPSELRPGTPASSTAPAAPPARTAAAPPVKKTPSGTIVLDDDLNAPGDRAFEDDEFEDAMETAGSRDAVEFSSAFAVPLDEEEGDDFVIPLAELDD